MASETSSAVLELGDADADETDVPGGVEGLGNADARDEGAPLIMEHGMDIAVKVDAPLKQLSTLETYVTYRVRCVCARWPTPPSVRRRYNHFKVLHKRLSAAHEWLAVPPLPPLHSARQQLDRYAPAFVAVRTLALHAFLDRVARHPILTHSEDFRVFLTTPDDELDKVFRSESGALSLWGLSSALYNNADKQHNHTARVKDPEFTSAAEYLTCLQHKLTALSALAGKLYQGSAALAREYMGMKRACDAWVSQTRGGALARALGGAGGGAGAAGGALARGQRPLRARALLPLLAAYAAAIAEKIRQRDHIHAAQVSEAASGVCAGGERADNRLALASEALRSDLADWAPKTRRDVKRELLDLATRRVTTLSQVVLGWEQALQLSSAASVEQLFKTVPRTALPPRAPPAPATPTETERDFDDLDNYSDSDLQDDVKPDMLQLDADGIDHDATDHDAIHHDATDHDVLFDKENGDVDASKLENSIDASHDVVSDPLQSFSEVDLSS